MVLAASCFSGGTSSGAYTRRPGGSITICLSGLPHLRASFQVLVMALNPSSSTEISRILNFWIFPVTVIGKSLVKRT
jgi:hypothetical protein